MQILESSIKALEIAKLASAGLPIPGLSIVLESALNIAKKGKDIKDTRDDCRTLAERAATLVLAVYQQLKNGSGDTGAKGHVTTLLYDMFEIENLMQRRLRAGRRERILFALKHGKIAREVKMLTTKLEDSFRAFMIQAALDIDHTLNTLANGNIHVLRHIEDSARVGDIIIEETRQIRANLSDLAHRGVGGGAIFDGNFRLFGRENLAFLEPIIDSDGSRHAATEHEDIHTVVRAATQPRTGRVYRYRALVRAAGELSGMQVVVYGYSNSHDQRFVESVKYAKQTCHPFLLAVLGYSRPGDPGEVAYIVTEDCIPCISHLGSLRGISKLRALLKAKAEICMAVDHLETVGLRERLPTYELWDVSTHSHAFGLDELVYDHRDGGRTKWTQYPLTSDRMDALRKIIEVPVMRTTRMRTAENLRAAACAPEDIVLPCWLSQILRPVGLYYVVVPGRLWWHHWGTIMDHPRYPLGVWLGRDGCEDEWTSLSARNPEFEIAAKAQRVPQVLPDSRQDSRNFKQRLGVARWLDVPAFDHNEMCLGFTLGSGGARTRWRRYQFSCLPVNQTLFFRQCVQILDGPETASEITHLLPDASEAGHYQSIGIAIERVYYTETSVTMATHAAERTPPPLWFFMLHFNGGDSDAHDCDVPCGFWSLEKHPSSVPADIVFDTTPRCEPIQAGSEAPLFTWRQVLGDLVFNIQMKMHTIILQLSEDELSAFWAPKENHSTSETDAQAHGSGDWDTGDFATYDISDRDNAGHLKYQDATDDAENHGAEDITPQERTSLGVECSF